ncbi:(2Fe-2S) ferredoxin domain-containing protein [Anaerococcus sp.]|uniref:(2Fe-2S) ferredoxin domain-containing protein n=1 Tax=Anaerococcus sp. TaxID=1872515 RepID=UPI002A9161DF|nr:(2Fe-2S) ferredoxin domain-containing protein [Anaerococcus sp.]MDY6127511.1 (2Fe-2S) ferredoxin domain-containing protein [Anaerococcus sp.]
MATCGIAAGARPVMLEFVKEIEKRGLRNVTVSQTGCIGMCRFEPMVDVLVPGQEKVTYVNLKPEDVGKIVAEHIVNGNVVTELTINEKQ